jgi:U4/U6 small nuclear ribonucleoprotein PRP4
MPRRFDRRLTGQIATGSDDHSVRVWDLRKKACAYTLPAHRSLVSAVRWQPGCGHYLLTASYDATLKAWSSRDWSLLKVLSGHEGKVMAADIAPAAGGGGGAQQRRGSADVSMEDAGGDGAGSGGGGGAGEELIASAGYDRTVKLWAPQDTPDLLAGDDDELPF